MVSPVLPVNGENPWGDKLNDALNELTGAINSTDSTVGDYISGAPASSSKTAILTLLQSLGDPLSASLTPTQRADIALPNPTLDHTPAVQSAINKAASRGGGVVSAAGLTLNIWGTLALPSHVCLIMPGTTMRGNGSNVAIETGIYDSTSNVTTSNVSEFGSGLNSAPNVEHALISGITFTGFGATALRLHRFNQGSEVYGCDIDAGTYSIWATYSWGQIYRNNTLRATMRLTDFVDWTIVEGNNFENCSEAGLMIGKPQGEAGTVFAGSYSLRVVGNGFHFTITGTGAAIMFNQQALNPVIESNHFESSRRHIYGVNGAGVVGARIKNNHLASTGINATYPVTAIEFFKLEDSTIESNDFVDTGNGFARKVKLIDAQCARNIVGIRPANANGAWASISDGLEINDNNILNVMGGLTTGQQIITDYTGSGSYTYEKFRSKYRFPANEMPFCTIIRSGSTHTITTDIDASATAVSQPAYFFLNFFGPTNTYRVAGRIAGRFSSVVYDANQNIATGGAGPTVSLSSTGGKLVITVSGLDNPSTMSGWVKAI